MVKYLALAALVAALAACTNVQKEVEQSDYVCKDGVEYFVYTKYTGSGVSYSVVPHFKPDGSLYTCKVPSK